MKALLCIISAFLVVSCASNAQTLTPLRLVLLCEELPAIKHITDMKVSSDTLLFVYESEDGYGQRFLRSAKIDEDNLSLNIGSEIGKKEDGYYTSYMPYPFLDTQNKMQIVSQDDCEIYDLYSDGVLTRTKQNVLDGKSIVPFPLSHYIQDVYSANPSTYVFIGREPNGGSQYVITANTMTHQVDTIRKIAMSPQLQTWMPNAGEMAFSCKYNRIAFAYRLHPVIDIIGMDGELIKQLRLSADTFEPNTLEQADFEDLNPLHTVDITVTPEYIYALVWGCRYSAIQTTNPTILKVDWNGNIADTYTISMPLYKIAVTSTYNLIGWTGKEFVLFKP
ncbi:MAG: TolB-like 6-bladed beta-propeller domain-containing protein [Bacteroidales bacterium]|nr:TolB-like 6-bladed beta-propeller domain-containing protein [Bacteroidales bacterium]